MRAVLPAFAAAVLFLPLHASAQASVANSGDPRLLDTAVVQGVVPGPGMWKVRKGANTLWVLGVQSPLPAKMQWEPGKVLSVIRRADAAIAPPSFSIGAKVGFFARVALVPSLFKARANPGGKQLKEVVPPALYGRWLALKARYIGRDKSVEAWRPIFAALTLYDRGIRKSGLSSEQVVEPVVAKAMKKRGIKPAPTTVAIQIADPKSALREFRGSQVADLDCFEKTLARLEGDLGHMRQRANAWAVGDVATIRSLPTNDQFSACSKALTDSGLGRKFGMDEMAAKAKAKWLQNAEDALAKHPVTFATLPMSLAISPDGYIAALAAKGYEVEAPR